jgi:hypothetical protein
MFLSERNKRDFKRFSHKLERVTKNQPDDVVNTHLPYFTGTRSAFLNTKATKSYREEVLKSISKYIP